jgi:hypothetical protein
MIANAERIAELRAAIDAERAEVDRRMARIGELANQLREAEQEPEGETMIAGCRRGLDGAIERAGNALENQRQHPYHAAHWIAVREAAQARADELRAQIAELEAGE